MSAIDVVQVALYTAMTADTGAGGVSTLVAGRIYNDVPNNALYPHVVMGKARERSFHTFGGRTAGKGWNITLPIHSLSRYQGDAEVLAIHKRIVWLLDFAALSVSGYGNVSCQYAPGGDVTGQVMVIDIDKIETRQVVAEFEIMVRP